MVARTSVVEITLFCSCLFTADLLCKRVRGPRNPLDPGHLTAARRLQIGVSTIIGEMAVGVVMGPNVLNLVPDEDFFRLAGVFGVTLMIFESGLHLDFAMLMKVGRLASIVAVLGNFLPLLSGMVVMTGFDRELYPLWPVGLAAGVTLAPTSVGMALKILGGRKQLSEEYGQLIVTAAFVTGARLLRVLLLLLLLLPLLFRRLLRPLLL